MPNRSSNAGHIPMRTCVVCKKKVDQKRLLNFFSLDHGIVFDTKRILSGRKNYLCAAPDCFAGLEKWQKRQQKRKSGIRK